MNRLTPLTPVARRTLKPTGRPTPPPMQRLLPQLMGLTPRRLCLLASALGALLLPLAPQAQTFPTRPLKIVVAQAPGSSVDVFARMLSTRLADTWKSPVIVENKPGANGNIGMDLLAKSTPDGYTIGVTVPSVMVINPFVYKSLPFKPLEDFAPISQTTSILFALVTHPKLPVQTVQELIHYARQQPGETRFSSAGVGNLQHLAAELFAMKAGVRLNHVPNKGDTPAMTDVMAGTTDFMFVPLPSAINHIRSGKLNLIAVATERRTAQFPQVPTLVEAGLPDLVIGGWLGLIAPKGTAESTIQDIHRTVAALIQEEGTRQRIEAQGFEVIASSPAEFAQFLRQESAKWSEVIRRSEIRLND